MLRVIFGSGISLGSFCRFERLSEHSALPGACIAVEVAGIEVVEDAPVVMVLSRGTFVLAVGR